PNRHPSLLRSREQTCGDLGRRVGGKGWGSEGGNRGGIASPTKKAAPKGGVVKIGGLRPSEARGHFQSNLPIMGFDVFSPCVALLGTLVLEYVLDAVGIVLGLGQEPLLAHPFGASGPSLIEQPDESLLLPPEEVLSLVDAEPRSVRTAIDGADLTLDRGRPRVGHCGKAMEIQLHFAGAAGKNGPNGDDPANSR